MKKYRVSGFIDEVGFAQLDINAISELIARDIAEESYSFYNILDVEEIKQQAT